MTVEVVQRATNVNLIELQTVKDRLGVSGSGSDGLFSELIAGASAVIESYLGRPLAYQGYRELRTGQGGVGSYLERYPVDRSTLVVTADGTDITVDVEVVDSTWGRVHYDSGFWSDVWDLLFSFSAGYKLPGDVVAWAATTAQASGVWIRPTVLSTTPWLLECTTAGTTAGTEPDWSLLAIGDTVTDGSVVWTLRQVTELPEDLKIAAWYAFHFLYAQLYERGDVVSRRVDGFSETYQPSAVVSGLPAHVRAMIDLYRVAPL